MPILLSNSGISQIKKYVIKVFLGVNIFKIFIIFNRLYF